MKITLQFCTILALYLFNLTQAYAQEETTLASKNGIKITYQLLLEEETKRKDKYILIVTTTNTNDQDLYYEIPMLTPDFKNSIEMNASLANFAKIKIRNSTGMFGDGVSVTGEETTLLTTANTSLMLIRSGEMLHSETTFKVRSGKKPLITNSFTRLFKPLNEFDLQISSAMIDGNYTSTCGNILINIESGKDPTKGDIIIQTVNGKQFTWLRTTDTTFIRENNDGYTLSYNQNKESFHYSTSDGISCTWEK
ncbi:hypothetical protein [Nonlabens sp. Asnod2-A12]|uniref:hypothetical protein n=1 Tax=Nonlabens sp. Asnod2-A12 TaxID=3160578 RepID=UPI00386D52A9